MKREHWMRTITTRWLDTNKGDEQNPNYRARLVAREIKRDKRDDLFAATPPLESLRMVISICASHQFEAPENNFLIMITDVNWAYFYAPANRRSTSRFLPRISMMRMPTAWGSTFCPSTGLATRP